ncbi:hypothetical protein D3C71_156410 [compost metagenome]
MDSNVLKNLLSTPGTPPFIAVLVHADGKREEMLFNWPETREVSEPSKQGPWDAISAAIDDTADQTCIELTRPQMRALLRRSGIMEDIIEFQEVDTVIRGMIADSLARELVGEGWPTYGDDADDSFFDKLSDAARSAGYLVIH